LLAVATTEAAVAEERLDLWDVLQVIKRCLEALATILSELLSELSPLLAERVLRELKKVEVGIDHCARLAEEAQDAKGRGVSKSRVARLRPASPRKRLSSPRDILLQKEANKGLDTNAFTITGESTGKFLVRVDGSELILPETPGELLRLISLDTSPEGGSDRNLVGWKSREVLAASMQKKFGHPFTRRYLNQLVYKLRKLFEANNQNPFLIQASKKHGIRLALKRADLRNSP